VAGDGPGRGLDRAGPDHAEPGRAGPDDTAYALKGTGRRELTAEDRAILAGLADRFPLFGCAPVSSADRAPAC
jgi:hypothetical protein